MGQFNIKRNHQGQALVEVLIGLFVAGILIGSASVAVSTALRSSATGRHYQTASSLNQKLISDVKTIVEADWRDIYDLTKGTKYHVESSDSALVIAGGPLILTIDGVDYAQSFTIGNVNRLNGFISETGGNDDPSTQKMTGRVQWTIAGQPAETVSTVYLTRWKNRVSRQSDWSGGADETRPAIKEFDNKFATSSDIDFSSIPGAIKIQGF